MTLADLVEKAKTTTKKWWKWILGGVIVLIVVLVVWRMNRQAKRIALLEAQKKGLEEKMKDLEVEVKNSTNQAIVDGLNAEIQHLREQIGVRQEEITAAKKECEDNQKAVDNVKTWQDLERQARGK